MSIEDLKNERRGSGVCGAMMIAFSPPWFLDKKGPQPIVGVLCVVAGLAFLFYSVWCSGRIYQKQLESVRSTN